MLNCLVISKFAPHFNKLTLLTTDMGGTVLKRKARRNKTKSRIRKQIIKLQGFKPVIKSIDLEAIKAEFKKNISKTASTKEKVSEKTEDKKAVKKTVIESDKKSKTVANAPEEVKVKQAEVVKEKKRAAKADMAESVKEKKVAAKKLAVKAKTSDAAKAKKKEVSEKK